MNGKRRIQYFFVIEKRCYIYLFVLLYSKHACIYTYLYFELYTYNAAKRLSRDEKTHISLSLPLIGCFGAALGPLLAALGPLLGCSWHLLGPSWALLGRSWALLDRSWAGLGLSWAALRRSKTYRKVIQNRPPKKASTKIALDHNFWPFLGSQERRSRGLRVSLLAKIERFRAATVEILE